MNKVIKVGVAGVGYLGRYHAEKYKAIPGVDLVGVADVEPERAEAVAANLGVKPFFDSQELIGRVDAISVVVPTKYHYEVARPFLKQGVHVMLEKPITRTLEEADSLIELAEKNNLVLQVGHLERFNPAFKTVSSMIDTPLFIEASRISSFPERGTDVDVVLDLMIHDLDIVLNLVGNRPVSVQAVGAPVVTNHVDIANARLEFDSGCVANLTASRISDKTLRKSRIFQKDAYFSIDYGERQVMVARRSAEGPSGKPETTTQELTVPSGDSLEDELRSFINSVANRSAPLVSGEDGRRALALALQIMTKINDRLKNWPEIAVEE
ncbi:MAG: Gfo/Idh/MocA family oxidoreductase [Deltaproteobacteria bacterium]|nr:Gfo/Idh/MocA family oxidoreductase [Deltaproteobacteria bacterium]MBW2052749.1 Gfo/Idh/MocA family oxidoreductase [Deltaproteobacteria bacterium]MBW2139804.1 Gfo/Idh/MocA family oxidoreductase [Deltaproteobacteria bacterium]MBW2322708.1 Gfo/Idh/MocA family oxidoreductase [Deltaproteobacteria bacterium]